MVKTLDDLTMEFTDKFGGEKSDAFIELLENITDTFNDLLSKNADVDKRLNKLDNDWREKYIRRFTTVDVVESPKVDVKEEAEVKETETEKSIDDLFTE